MKKTIFLTALALILTASGNTGAQMMGGPDMMQNNEKQEKSKAPHPQQEHPYMMHPGMMGGYGMEPGMMGGCGYDMGPGMMHGYGMAPGMMGGYGMGYGMMGRHGYGRHMPGACWGYGYGEEGEQGFADQEKLNKFLDETRELRKKLHDMRFDYKEMLRNPDTTMKEKMDMEKEMFELRQKIQEKAGE